MGLKGLRNAMLGSNETLVLSRESGIKYSQCPLAGEWIGKMCWMYTKVYYTTIRSNRLATWIELRNRALNLKSKKYEICNKRPFMYIKHIDTQKIHILQEHIKKA